MARSARELLATYCGAKLSLATRMTRRAGRKHIENGEGKYPFIKNMYKINIGDEGSGSIRLI
jgi:hypothetical protein